MSWMREYAIPIVVTVLLHVILLFWLASDFTATPKPHTITKPKFIKANLVQLKQQKKAVKKEPKQVVKKAPKKPSKKVVPQKRDDSKQKALAAKRLQDQKRKAAEKARLAKEQTLREQKERERQEQIRQQQEREAELEKQRRAQELMNNLEAEEALLEAGADEATAMSYMAEVQRAIESNWSRPASARNGMEVTLEIRMVPNGTVTGVTIVKRSGNEAFDRSALAAVEKASPIVELKGMEPRVFDRYYRQFKLIFKPEDLRL